MTNSAVNLRFRYSEADFVKAMRSHYATQLRVGLDLTVLLICFFVGIYLWRTPDLRWLGVTALAVSGVFVLILITAFFIIPPIAFRRDPKLRDEYSLTFSEEGIHFKTEAIDSQLQWNLYSRALVDSSSYVLYYGRHNFTVVPKRVFQNDQERSAFDTLLTLHVQKIITKR